MRQRLDNDGSRRSVVVLEKLRCPPADLTEATELLRIAADEIDRLLTAINNAQSVLSYEGMSAEDRNHAAAASLSFGDK